MDESSPFVCHLECDSWNDMKGGNGNVGIGEAAAMVHPPCQSGLRDGGPVVVRASLCIPVPVARAARLLDAVYNYFGVTICFFLLFLGLCASLQEWPKKERRQWK